MLERNDVGSKRQFGNWIIRRLYNALFFLT